MNLITEIQNFETKVKALEVIVSKDMEQAALAAAPIMQKIADSLTSPAALVVESLIPNGAAYGADVLSAINAAMPAIKLISGLGDTSSTNGLLQRLGSNITSIIHGGKHPFSWYVSAFDYFVFGVGQVPA